MHGRNVLSFSTEHHQRQKLSFGIWTNASSPSLLFSAPVSTGGAKEANAVLEVGSDIEGSLRLLIVDPETGLVVASDGPEAPPGGVPVSGGHWLRVSLVVQHGRVKVQVEGGAGGRDKWAWHLKGEEEVLKTVKFVRGEPTKYGN